MPDIVLKVPKNHFPYCNILFIILVFSSCTIIRKAPAGRPYLVKNHIEVKGGNFTKTEKTALIQRLNGQLDDSSTVKVKDKYFFFHYITRPPAYDSGYSAISSANMRASMFHLGYYNAKVNFSSDTVKGEVSVRYVIEAGKPTLIDTVSYRLRKPDLQEIAVDSKDEGILVKNNPVTKAGVLGEISRLVDSFRNNGYYKFTAAELRVRGDTTIEALTSVSDDPFEQLRLLAEAQQKKDSPQIRLAVVINPPTDTSKLNKFYINKIFILSDFMQGDDINDTLTILQRPTRNFILRYHEKLFRTGFLARNITMRSGDLFRQYEYYRTLNNLSKTGVWQSVNILIKEEPGSINKVNLIIELIPNKKYGFQAALEASYSSSSSSNNTLSGNLLGLSGNLSLLNRNVGKEAIRMTHTIRAGIELNNRSRGSNSKLVNSNELSYGNSIAIPRLILPRIANALGKNKKQTTGETFINTNLSYNNRLNLFSLQSVNLNYGWSITNKRDWRWIWRPLYFEFSYLFNQSDSFLRILGENPFLRYSYNTASAFGMGLGVSKTFVNPKHLNSLSRERNIKINFEESGITWGLIPALNRYKRRFIKLDAEYKYTISFRKTALAFRGFVGVGVPLLGSDTNRRLPFFKQYFGGGSNSMRGWPIRGIGTGGQALVPFNSTKTLFNDRTGDMQVEGNIEYRYDIARIIPNTLTLRGAVFIDAGNIWNLLNFQVKKAGDSSQLPIDTSQFALKNLYKQLGVSAGTGFRLDFNYLILRFDLGFRFKRPELYNTNNGWKVPPIGFDDLFKKLFSRGSDNQYRKWRYENFNFTIGISYPF